MTKEEENKQFLNQQIVEKHFSLSEKELNLANDYETFMAKAACGFNAGGVVVLLTFIGTAISKGVAFNVWPLILFWLATLVSFASVWLLYLAANEGVLANNAVQIDPNNLELKNQSNYDLIQKKAQRFRSNAFKMIVASIIITIIGSINFVSSLAQVGIKPVSPLTHQSSQNAPKETQQLPLPRGLPSPLTANPIDSVSSSQSESEK